MKNETTQYTSWKEFATALEANNKRQGFATWYLNHALPRGWKTFRHLPPGTGKEHLLDVGGMGGLFAPAYFDLFGYGQVTVLGNDAPASGRVTIERECGPWDMPANNWKANPEPVPLFQALLHRRDIWAGVVPRRRMVRALTDKCNENAWFYRNRGERDRARWFVRQAFKADWLDLRAWRHAVGMLSDRDRGAGE